MNNNGKVVSGNKLNKVGINSNNLPLQKEDSKKYEYGKRNVKMGMNIMGGNMQQISNVNPNNDRMNSGSSGVSSGVRLPSNSG